MYYRKEILSSIFVIHFVRYESLCRCVRSLHHRAILTSQPHSTPQENQSASTAQGNKSGAVGVNDNENKAAKDTATANDDPPKWYAAPEWWLIPVGLVTFGAICWQAVEMRRATEAMQRATEIQSAGMRQWVDVKTNRMHANFEKSIVNFHFRIVNNTDYPFTIQKIVTKATFHVDWEVFTITTNVTVPPRRKTKSEGYPFYISMNLKEAEMEWVKNGTIVTINGEIGFVDCLQRPDSDYFGGLYRVKEQLFEYLEPVGMKPDHTTEHYERNPN